MDRITVVLKRMDRITVVLTVIVLLISTTSSTSAAEAENPPEHTDVCQLPSCTCINTTTTTTDHHTHTHPHTLHVACSVQFLGPYDPTMQQLTSDVTSLTLTCSNALMENRLTSQSFSRLPSLEYLGLENCRFTEMANDSLNPLSHLQVLKFSKCAFNSKFPAQFFNTARELARLTLTQCGFQALPHVCDLQSLRFLNVSGQNLTSVDELVKECDSETELQKLDILDVSHNKLSDLPYSVLTGATNLRELYVQGNRISDLSFTGCTKLEVLNVLGQRVHRANFTAQGCTVVNLKDLRLEGNGSMLFPIHHLKSMPNLASLQLESVALNDEFWEVLPSFKNLGHLALPGNNLTSVNLTTKVSLHHLNLSSNAIADLESNTFSSQKDIVVLDLSWNKITRLRNGLFVNFTSLKTLNLQHNRLQLVFYNALRSLPSLQGLYLDHNQLRSLPLQLLREMKTLRELTVNHNSLTTLPFIKKATKLVLVSTNHNQLTSLPILLDLPNLTYLFMKGNRLRHVNSAMFLKAPNLYMLDLSNNTIKSLDPFHDHPNLRWLRLDDNQIQDMTLKLVDLPHLSALFLDNNYVTRLTSTILPRSLRTLSLSWNLLTYVEPRMFVSKPHLMAVNIAANGHLYRIPQLSVQVSPSLLPKPAFTVGPNSFECDCQMAYLKAWDLITTAGDSSPELLNSMPDFLNLRYLYCVSGEGYVLFDDVPLSDFVCPYKNSLCDNCPCCSAESLQRPTNCTCLLTCPDPCVCFHGGSRHVQLYTHVVCKQRNLTEVPDLLPARATHVRLDGNSLAVLRNGTLKHVTSVMFLYLNASEINVLEQGCFHGLDFLQLLDLSSNNIEHVEKDTFGRLGALQELYLQNNHIQYIDPAAFSQLSSLKLLHLNNNGLKEVDSFAAFPPTADVYLASNPWSCDCDFIAMFVKFLISHEKNVLDYSSLRCCFSGDVESLTMMTSNGTAHQSNDTIHTIDNASTNHNESGVLISDFDFSQFCRNASLPTPLPTESSHSGHMSTAVTATLVSVVMVAVLVGVAGVVLVRWCAELKAWLYVKVGVRLWDKAVSLDRQFVETITGKNALEAKTEGGDGRFDQETYDAFVSYSHRDQDFVVNTLVPRLEQQGPRRYRLCVHYRDFPVGECIADSITDSIQNSQRVLMLLSGHFLDSEWCRFEFSSAHQHVLREGGHRLVMVLMEDLPEERLNPDLKMAMKTHTYLTLKDPWFWEKLYFAMPDLPCRSPHGNQNGARALPSSSNHLPETQDVAEIQNTSEHLQEIPILERVEQDIVQIQNTSSNIQEVLILENVEPDIPTDELSSVKGQCPYSQNNVKGDPIDSWLSEVQEEDGGYPQHECQYHTLTLDSLPNDLKQSTV